MSNWQDLLDRQTVGGAAGKTATATVEAGEADLALPPDPAEYRPWLLQRGQGRPAMFIDFRRFEPKTGVLIGCQMSYPHLISVDYIGERMVSLDFGTRHIFIEGAELGDLPKRLQQGAILAVQEYSHLIWPNRPMGSIIHRIVADVRS